jgi:hypothetical protein
MVFNPTSCAKRRRSGFTLVEYLVATSVGLLVITAALVLWAYGTKTCASLLAYVELSSASKNAFGRMSQQIRTAKGVQSCSTTNLVLIVPGKTLGHQHTMTYGYDPNRQSLLQTLRKNPGNEQTLTLLTGCSNFSFSVFQRTPVSNSFGLYTNAWSTNTAKVVQVRWTCYRLVTGDRGSIENQLSAKVVIRSQ